MAADATVETFDVVVVGAGFAGMYLLHRLRGAGFRAIVVEAATDLGGTWYWNRYPGARCDVPSMEYSYSFDPELEQEWRWTEVMSAQPEILAYANHVAERYDLRRDIRFERRVTSATWNEQTTTWRVTTDRGEVLDAPFAVMATGCLSAANTPDLPGLADFAGTLLHTGRWPKEPVDLSGRVGVIGTGSSGVQAIPVIAETAAQLVVFQRTPVITFPANNKPLRDDVQEAYKAHYDEVRERQRTSPTGFSGWSPLSKGSKRAERAVSTGVDGAASSGTREILRTTPEERRAAFERYGFSTFQRYRDVYRDLEANELACELFRDHVRSVVHDPAVAEKLLPRDYPLGCKRQVIDTGYYETFNRPNVTLVDLRDEPLAEITATGVRTAAASYELDTLVLATGFDAMTGALDRIDICGRDGRLLRDEWAAGARSYLGLQVSGFPNLFTVTGPGSPSVLSNVIVSIEHHVDWIMACLEHLRSRGATTIEASPEAEAAWGQHVNEVAEGTMYTVPSCSSWYLGANIPGKPRQFLPYVGGVGRYRERCAEIVRNDYEGFVVA